MDDQKFQELLNKLSEVKSLFLEEISDCSLEQFQQLCEKLAINKTITQVWYYSSKRNINIINPAMIDEEKARAFAECLKINTTITFINLTSVQIARTGVKLLIESFKINKTIEYINLSYNQNIGDEEALLLAKSLEKNTILTSLDLRYTSISNVAAVEIATILKDNVNLNSFGFYNYQIIRETEITIAEIMQNNHNITIYSPFKVFEELNTRNFQEAKEIIDQLIILKEENYITLYKKLYPRFNLIKEITKTRNNQGQYNNLQIDEIYNECKEAFESHKQDIISMCNLNTLGLKDPVGNVIFKQFLTDSEIADLSIGDVEQAMKEMQNIYKKKEGKLTSLEKDIRDKGIGAISILIKYIRSTDKDVRRVLTMTFANVYNKYTDMLDRFKYVVDDIKQIAEIKKQIKDQKEIINRSYSGLPLLYELELEDKEKNKDEDKEEDQDKEIEEIESDLEDLYEQTLSQGMLQDEEVKQKEEATRLHNHSQNNMLGSKLMLFAGGSLLLTSMTMGGVAAYKGLFRQISSSLLSKFMVSATALTTAAGIMFVGTGCYMQQRSYTDKVNQAASKESSLG